MAELRIELQSLPPLINYPIILKAGYIADDGSLTDVTDDVVFTLSYGTATKTANNVFISNQLGSIGITAVYSAGGIQTDINIQTVVSLEAATQQDFYNLLKQEEPGGVYSQSTETESYSYLDNWVTSGLYADVAKDGLENYLNVYPELATDLIDWYIQAFDSNIITPAYPNKLLQQINNLRLITTASAFVVTSNITEFIYNLTGFEIPVYIDDLTINVYDYWILGNVNNSTLGVNTYIAEIPTNQVGKVYILNQGIATFSQDQINLINRFISSLIRPTKQYDVVYNELMADFGFTIDIGDTYNGDIRLGNNFAIVHSETAFYNFIAYKNIFTPENVIDLRVEPISGSTITGFTPFKVYGVFGDFEKEITLLTKIFQEDNNILVAWQTLIPVNLYTTTTFDIQYGDITKTVTYNIGYAYDLLLNDGDSLGLNSDGNLLLNTST